MFLVFQFWECCQSMQSMVLFWLLPEHRTQFEKEKKKMSLLDTVRKTVHSSQSEQMLIFSSPWIQCNRLGHFTGMFVEHGECMCKFCAMLLQKHFREIYCNDIPNVYNFNLCKTQFAQNIRQFGRLCNSNKFQCMFNIQWSDVRW